MMQRLSKDRKESGIVLILLTISITAIIGFIGLAIDIGNLYRTGLHVQKAADAGSLAAVMYKINHARGDMASGATSTDESIEDYEARIETNSKNIAFTNLQISGVASPDEDNIVDGDTSTRWSEANQKMFLTVKDTAKLFFISTFINGTTNANSTTQIRRAESELGRANVSLIIDISGSMACPTTDRTCNCRLDNSCPTIPATPNAAPTSVKIGQLQDAIAGDGGFLDQFDQTRDRINIVPFNMAASLARSVRLDPSTVRDGFAIDGLAGPGGLTEVKTIVNSLRPKSATNVADALITAFDDYQVIANEEVFYVLFSDGAPTATTALPTKITPSPPGDALLNNYYQIFGIDFVDAAGTATKGVSPFIGRVPPDDAGLAAFSLFNREDTATFTTTPPYGSFSDTTNSAKFICGKTDEPVTGCDTASSTGQITRPGSCGAFNDAFDDICTSNFKFRVHPTKSSAVYKKTKLRDMYKFFYDMPIAVSDMIRKNNGTIYVIGLGLGDKNLSITTDPYQNEYTSFYRKDFFLNRIALDNDDDDTQFKRLSNFEFSLVPGASADSVTATDRQGEYLATSTPAALKDLYKKIAQKILIKLVK